MSRKQGPRFAGMRPTAIDARGRHLGTGVRNKGSEAES